MSGQWVSLLLIHLPIALLVIGGLFDLYGFARRRPAYQRVAVALLVVGLLGGLVSAVIGFSTSSTTLHELWAIATLVIFGGLLALRLAARRGWSPRLKGMYIAFAITGILTLAITGFYGAELIAGFGD